MAAEQPGEGREGKGVLSDGSEDEILLPPAGEEDWYDPEVDEADEKWSHRQRRGRPSDAVLSCPACFTTLCIDCQRHDKYENQFRAMFVRNCRIVDDEILKVAPQENRKTKKATRKRGKRRDIEGQEVAFGNEQEKPAVEEFYKSVCCTECGTQVAVLDVDEVYHFFAAIPSYS